MATTAVLRIQDALHEWRFRRDIDGFLATVGADLIKTYEGLVIELAQLAKATNRLPRPVGALDVSHIFLAWPNFYRTLPLETQGPWPHFPVDNLIVLDLARVDIDYFGVAQCSDYQGMNDLEDNLQWFTLEQFRVQVNDERAFLEKAVAEYRKANPEMAADFSGFPPI